jgi:chromate transporter
VGAVRETFAVFLRLGLTSFGGPIAHVGHFRREFVGRRRWMDDAEFADTVALCQSLPGPTSSQVGFAVGLRRAGFAGGIAAWAGFTAPSAVLLGAAGWWLADVPAGPWMTVLHVVAVAVVTHALHGMARTLLPSARHAVLAVAAAVGVFAAERAAGEMRGFVQPVAIVAGAAIGAMAFRGPSGVRARAEGAPAVGRTASAIALALFAAMLAATVLARGTGAVTEAAATCMRAGSLVFGGGHVVLPLLQEPFDRHGWLEAEQVISGYALAQAAPGPLFTMAAYLGAAMQSDAGPAVAAGTACLLVACIFLPGLLLVVAALPAWDRLRAAAGARAALAGANCAVVGLLGAALADLVLRMSGK